MIRAELRHKPEQQVRDLAVSEQELALQRQRLENDRKEREIHLEESREKIELIESLMSKLK